MLEVIFENDTALKLLLHKLVTSFKNNYCLYLQLSVSTFTNTNVSNIKNSIKYKDPRTRVFKDTLKKDWAIFITHL